MKQFTMSLVVLIVFVAAAHAGMTVQKLSFDSQSLGKPASLASGDLNEDGVPDLVVGYDQNGRGSIAIFLGIEEALFSRATQINPFRTDARTIEIPESADFVGVGDFDADGHLDIVAAQKGSNRLYWLSGNGKATRNGVLETEVQGSIDRLFIADVNRKDLLTDVVVGISDEEGSSVLLYESPEGALKAEPESTKVSAPVSAIVAGQLDDSYESDLAVACGAEIVIIHGHDRRLGWPKNVRADVAAPSIEHVAMPFLIHSLSIDGKTNNLVAMPDQGNAWMVQRQKTEWITAPSAQMDPGQSMNTLGEPETILPMRLNGDAATDSVVITKESSVPLIMLSAPNLIFVVNSTGDGGDSNTADNACDDGSGMCTLRAAIQQANVSPGLDEIDFNIPSGPFVIAPSTELGAISDPVVIDGTTQPGSSVGVWPPTLKIELQGNAAMLYGLLVSAPGSGSLIRGLVIHGFTNASGRGILVSSSSSNLIEYNLIGTDVTGTLDLGNSIGIQVAGSSFSNLIGGSSPGSRNLISGNSGLTTTAGIFLNNGAENNFFWGNYIGTDVSGTAAIPNAFAGIYYFNNSTNNSIGGTFPGAGNVISGNAPITPGDGSGYGIFGQSFTSQGNIIAGNKIGTNASGTVAIPNSGSGIFFSPNVNHQTIGGTSAAARNIISGNSNGIEMNGNNQDNVIQGNYVGTNAAGTAAIANVGNGFAAGSAFNNLIGGTTPGARNLFSGNGFGGINLFSCSSNTIQGNFIGTNANGLSAIPNAAPGILFQSSSNSNQVGGVVAGSRNLISGNGDGIVIISGSSGNIVQGNSIGTNINGTSGIPNIGPGILIGGGAVNNKIGGNPPGEGNILAFNTNTGITVYDNTGNAILGNSIFLNDGLGIDLDGNGVTVNDPGDPDTGANNHQNFPMINSATYSAGVITLQGFLDSAPNTTFILEFFSDPGCDASGFGEGRNYIGATEITTGGSGPTSFSIKIAATLNPGEVITATATDPQGNTSEFSPCSSIQAVSGCVDGFDDLDASDWTFDKPNLWSASTGELIASANGTTTTGIFTPCAGITTGFVEADVRMTGGNSAEISLYGWYQNSKNNIELIAQKSKNRWILKHRVSGKVVATAINNQVGVQANVTYHARIAFDGSTINVSLNGTPAIILPTNNPASGQAGFRASKTVGVIDNVVVSP